MPFCELMDILVGGGDCERRTVKFPGVMMERRDLAHGVVRCDWKSRRKWSVIADWRIVDAIANNEPPAEELGKCRCDALAWTDMEDETATGVESIADVEDQFDRRA
jgi:hypothetical protein